MNAQLKMTPAPGEKRVAYVGDCLHFKLAWSGPNPGESGRAFLRTTLGRAQALRDETRHTLHHKLPLRGTCWRDVPMRLNENGWSLQMLLTETGFFHAKAYWVDEKGRQVWADGPDFSVSVQPNHTRTGNTIYCAFTRSFGEASSPATNELLAAQMQRLDKLGFAVIPPSGKFRDLIRQLPHIFGKLRCRILHLLPVNPVPVTYARFGRFGSPYAVQDLTAIDPALVEFDRRSTGIEQFEELAFAVHRAEGLLFLDVVINHTGWGSKEQENHPDWFLRKPDKTFVSPGAWDVIWEDLVEIDHHKPDSWDYLADVFLIWCRRGVDGFRCDAGYKVPAAAWRHIVAAVRSEFPDTVFLLEGLGGSWDATETLLTDGGMQWAYSELFQNYSGIQVSGYLDHALQKSATAGILAHYSETHDNDRLAKKGRAWSLLRNRLCALTSVAGAYGFTCGVEWLAEDRINVHENRSLSWGQEPNIVHELGNLNEALLEHPCFFDGARLTRLSEPGASVYLLRRDSEEDLDHLLVIANLDLLREQIAEVSLSQWQEMGSPDFDLLEKEPSRYPRTVEKESVRFKIPAAGVCCFAAGSRPKGLHGQAYRDARARAAFAVKAFHGVLPPERLLCFDWKPVAELVRANPAAFLAAASDIDSAQAETDLLKALRFDGFPCVVTWKQGQDRRITMVPARHWLLIQDDSRFRARLEKSDGSPAENVESVPVDGGHVAAFLAPPARAPQDCTLSLERYGSGPSRLQGTLRFLGEEPRVYTGVFPMTEKGQPNPDPHKAPRVLLTNGRGSMARLDVDLGRVDSKYDCLLGANLHSSVPVDRHIFVKRLRVWVNADGFISPLNGENLLSFEAGPPAKWTFAASAGAGDAVQIEMLADMLPEKNATLIRFHRASVPAGLGHDLSEEREVHLVIRFDLEDRNFHWETQRSPGADQHFAEHCRILHGQAGFEFVPSHDRQLRIYTDKGTYHPEPEWSQNLPHPIEQSRGQTGAGDGFSPGWFDVKLQKNAASVIVVSAESVALAAMEVHGFPTSRTMELETAEQRAGLKKDDSFGRQLARAAQAFVVRRGEAKTVIAGYPWFLDWGRDSLICARGLLAAGFVEEVRQLLITFGRFEKDGTLPNTIHGEDASNRDTSDAPLWYGVVCEETAAIVGEDLYKMEVEPGGRTIADVLCSLARHYARGTPNGIVQDESSALIWSPRHFTWMDTNHPAGTPREGYPIEIQALWVRLLRLLHKLKLGGPDFPFGEWAERAVRSIETLYWDEEKGYLADLLISRRGIVATEAIKDTALRSNNLFAVTFGLVRKEIARRTIRAAWDHLVVPGALRTLAPLRVDVPLPIYNHAGHLLNDPYFPYWGRYEGDEDTKRKPAYHNGTAWTWTFPGFCEALALAWDNTPAAVGSARSFLGSMADLLFEGSLGQIPEILDGDAPHVARGCDAQAWGVTEALRVWKKLQQ